MAKINLITGSAGSYYYFKDKVAEHIAAGEENSYLYLLPVNRAVRYLKKQLLNNSGKQALIDPPVYTFASLIRYIYDRSGDKRKVIPASIRLSFLRHVVEKNRDALSYLKFSGTASPGLILKIDRMLGELSQFGFRPGKFDTPPESATLKYADLELLMNALYGVYGSEMIDDKMLFTETTSTLDSNFLNQIFPELKSVYINGYGIFTPPMIDLIRLMSDQYPVHIKLDYDQSNHDLFAHTYEAFDALRRLPGTAISTDKNITLPGQTLFGYGKTEQIAADTVPRFIEIGAPTREAEVRQIAATIRQLYHQDKVPLHRIGVTFPDLERYAAVIRKIFGEFEIPYNLSTGLVLAQSPLVQAYLQVLKVRLSGFSAEELRRLLVSPFLHEKYRVNMTRFQQLVSRYQIIRFDEKWAERFTGQHRDMSDEINELAEKINGIISLIAALKTNLPFHETRVEYFKLLDQLGMLKWFDHQQSPLNRVEREREFRAYNRFYKLINQLDWISDLQPASLNEFSTVLHLVVRDESYNLREWSSFGVQCMPRLEIQSIECDVLFFGGLVEGEFPRTPHRDIFFNDNERKHLGLYATEDLLAQDRFQFYQLISSPARMIYLSYPQFDEEAALLPSSFLRSLKDVARVSAKKETEGPDQYLTRKNFPEYLAGRLKTDLPDNIEAQIIQWLNTDHTVKMPHLIKVIEALYDKSDRSKITRFEGNLTENKSIQSLLKKSIEHRTFSITALELYAFCPIKYYLKRILGLEEEEEERAPFSPLERGTLIHNILFRFYTELKKEGNHDRPWEFLTMLESVARNEIDKLPYHGVTWELEKELILGRTGHKGLLQKFLEMEHDQAMENGFVPAYFEFAFGMGDRTGEIDGHSVPDPFTVSSADVTVRMSGKIDRIDVDKNGLAMVIDYKTGKGKNAAIREINAGKSLQLPVYLAAVGQFLENHDPVAGVYYQVRDAQHCKRTIAISDDERAPDLLKRGHGKLPNNSYPIGFDAMIRQSLDFVVQHVLHLNSGDFRHTENPDDENCRSYCLFNKVCRKDVAKLKAMME